MTGPKTGKCFMGDFACHSCGWKGQKSLGNLKTSPGCSCHSHFCSRELIDLISR